MGIANEARCRCSFLPPGHGSRVLSHRRGPSPDEGSQKGHDQNDERFCLAQSFTHRSSMRAQGLSTHVPVADHGACLALPSCRTAPLGAQELRRILLGFCVLHPFTVSPLMRLFPTQWEIIPPDTDSVGECGFRAQNEPGCEFASSHSCAGAHQGS